MANDLQRLDAKVSFALGLEPDYTRIARADQSDQDPMMELAFGSAELLIR